MKLEEFVQLVANELQETPIETISAETHFRELEEWNSLCALSVISSIDDAMDILITGADIRKCTTIADLYNIVINK